MPFFTNPLFINRHSVPDVLASDGSLSLCYLRPDQGCKCFSSVLGAFLDPNVQTKYMTAENVSIGIGAILECLEMT